MHSGQCSPTTHTTQAAAHARHEHARALAYRKQRVPGATKKESRENETPVEPRLAVDDVALIVKLIHGVVAKR